MEKVINKLINYHIEGVDTYTHSNSTWLIFTKTKQWVIELTDNKTLWYNYNFFNSVFSYASLDVVQNQHLITKWVEDNVINKVEKTRMAYMKTDWSINDTIENGVKETKISPTHTEYGDWLDGDERLDNIIQNGIKKTQFNWHENKSWVEGVIKGGVKQTLPEVGRYINDVEEVIQDGVKKTHFDSREIKTWIDGVINKGVKQTSHRRYLKTFNIDDTIQDGTENDYWVMDGHDTPVDEVLDNGIRETKGHGFEQQNIINNIVKDGVKETKNAKGNYMDEVDDVIKNGVKETKTPGRDGDIISTVEWMKENNATSYPKMIDDVIDNGEKINGTYAGGQRQSEKCKSVVEYGTKNPTD
jgi:hypothetical protein